MPCDCGSHLGRLLCLARPTLRDQHSRDSWRLCGVRGGSGGRLPRDETGWIAEAPLNTYRPASTGSVPCDCCGQPAPRTHLTQEWGFCQICRDAGCGSLGGGGSMHRADGCPLLQAVATSGDVCMCLHCDKPLHRSEPLNFIDNANPGLGGCHARCVDAYWRARKEGA